MIGRIAISPPASGRGRGWACDTVGSTPLAGRAPTPNPSRTREGDLSGLGEGA